MMMRFFDKKILLALFVVSFSLMNAQSNGPGVPCGAPIAGSPPCSPTSPIDMYVYILAAVAILGIGFFATKYKTQKI